MNLIATSCGIGLARLGDLMSVGAEVVIFREALGRGAADGVRALSLLNEVSL